MPSTEKQKEASKRWYYANQERQRVARKEYYNNNKEECKQRNKEWKCNNREAVRAHGRKNWKKYVNRKAIREWRLANAEKLRAQARARYRNSDREKAMNTLKASRRRAARCKWANEELIKEIYAKARMVTKETGIKHVVDHIVPIKNKYVCGLHNEFNLTVITQHENAVKKNRFELGIV